MDESRFWTIIERSRDPRGDLDAQLESLRSQLEALSRRDVIAFKGRLNEVMARAYKPDLIEAACFIGVGRSDDGFMDFRAWLVSLGRKTFETVLADVQVLAELPFRASPTEEWHAEELHMLPLEILDEDGEGDDLEDAAYDDDPAEPLGERIEITKSSLMRRYPRLWKRFGDRWMIGIR